MIYALVAAALWTVVLNHLYGVFLFRVDGGKAWAGGDRDGDHPGHSILSGRAARAHANHHENVIVFLALCLAAIAMDRTEGIGLVASWVFVGARVGHATFYILGVAPLRSLCHALSLGAIVTLALTLVGVL